MARPEVTGKKTGRRLLNYQALKERGIPWSRVHIARLEAARKFPLHIDVGENSIAWFEDEIDDLLEMKSAERDAKAAALDAAADSPITDLGCDCPPGHARKRQPRTTRPGHTHQEVRPRRMIRRRGRFHFAASTARTIESSGTCPHYQTTPLMLKRCSAARPACAPACGASRRGARGEQRCSCSTRYAACSTNTRTTFRSPSGKFSIGWSEPTVTKRPSRLTAVCASTSIARAVPG